MWVKAQGSFFYPQLDTQLFQHCEKDFTFPIKMFRFYLFLSSLFCFFGLYVCLCINTRWNWFSSLFGGVLGDGLYACESFHLKTLKQLMWKSSLRHKELHLEDKKNLPYGSPNLYLGYLLCGLFFYYVVRSYCGSLLLKAYI